MEKMIGKWAFIIGVLLAIVAGIIPALQTATVGWAFIVLGLVIGFLNVTEKETTEFLIAAIALMTIGAAGLAALNYIGGYITAILANIVTIVAPAALVVAIKSVYAIGQTGKNQVIATPGKKKR